MAKNARARVRVRAEFEGVQRVEGHHQSVHPYISREYRERESVCKGGLGEPIICTNLFGLIDATAARLGLVSCLATQSCRILWRAKKSIKHFSASAAAVPLPRGNP